MATGLKFRTNEVEGLYYLCSENKGADQLRGYREADLRLCFRICKKPVLSQRGSFNLNHSSLEKLSQPLTSLQRSMINIFSLTTHTKEKTTRGVLREGMRHPAFMTSRPAWLTVERVSGFPDRLRMMGWGTWRTDDPRLTATPTLSRKCLLGLLF